MDIRLHPFSEDILIAEVHHLPIPGSKDSYVVSGKINYCPMCGRELHEGG